MSRAQMTMRLMIEARRMTRKVLNPRYNGCKSKEGPTGRKKRRKAAGPRRRPLEREKCRVDLEGQEGYHYSKQGLFWSSQP